MATVKESFRRGFVAGMSSPYTSVFGGRFVVKTRPHNTVAASWYRVGKAVQAAMTQEEQSIGKTHQIKPGREPSNKH